MSGSLLFRRPMERRTNRRLPCRTPVRIYATPGDISDSFILQSSNVSPNGVFLQTDFLFDKGEWVDLEFVVPGRARPVKGRGQVVRVHVTSDPPGPGVAIHLPDLSIEEQTALGRMSPSSVKQMAH